MRKFTELLNNYLPISNEEEIFKKHMQDFIRNYDNIFSREQTYGHFTASAFLLNSDCTKFLLMHHKKINMWIQPGGHCDEDDDLLRVALKEAKEESGIDEIVPINDKIFDLDIHIFPAMQEVTEHFHFDIRFLLKTEGNDNYIKNSESHDLKWIFFHDFNPDELKLTHSVTKMVEKYERYKN